MDEYRLVRCLDQESIFRMHEIRETVLFTSSSYDRDHSDDKNPDNHCFVFFFNSNPVGTVRLDFINSKEAAVRLFAILPEYQGQKIGTKMFNALENYAANIGIVRLFTNAAVNAKTFYESVGFIVEDWNDTGEGSSQPTMPMVKMLK